MPENGKTNILIADAQFLTGTALEHILSEKYTVTARVCTKADLLSILNKKEVQILIIDYTLFDLEGLSELSTIKENFPSVNILILTNTVTRPELNELNQMGIKNILLKTTDDEELFMAIDAARKAKKYYSQEILDMLTDQNTKKERTFGQDVLTTSETEIVRLIAQGLTTKEIAKIKFISFHTVMTHRKNIFRKLNVSSVSELIMHAIKAGWIDNIEYYI